MNQSEMVLKGQECSGGYLFFCCSMTKLYNSTLFSNVHPFQTWYDSDKFGGMLKVSNNYQVQIHPITGMRIRIFTKSKVMQACLANKGQMFNELEHSDFLGIKDITLKSLTP